MKTEYPLLDNWSVNLGQWIFYYKFGTYEVRFFISEKYDLSFLHNSRHEISLNPNFIVATLHASASCPKRVGKVLQMVKEMET